MTKYPSIARHAFLLLTALSLSGCPFDSDDVRHDIRSEDSPSGTDVNLEITAPVSSSEMDTTDTSVSLSGVASSDLGIYKVSWSDDHGNKGVASGTGSWKTGSIDLELGENEITVTAEDTAGTKQSRRINVKRESGQKGSATLSWSPPATRVDGSPLTNLAGYKIDYGRMSGVYDYQIDVNNPGLLTYVVESLVSGEWYFAVAAYDSDGLHSDRSNEAVRTIN
jgi:hypothetical protein